MGQYREWLKYRERDQLLRQQNEQLEGELAAIEQRIRALQPLPALEENEIIRALLQRQSMNRVFVVPEPPEPALPLPEPTHPPSKPDLAKPSLEEIPSLPSQPYTRVVPASLYEPLTPNTQEMVALSKYDATVYPDWLRRALPHQPMGDDTPVDVQALHTNRLVQRWLARWGRQNEAPAQQKEDH